MRKLFPLLLALVGLGVGAGAGLALRPAPEPADAANEAPDNSTEAVATAEGCQPVAGATVDAETPPTGEPGEKTHDYVKMNNQFVVPVVEDGHVASLVILSLSLEVPLGAGEQVYAREPKLRDAFLQVLFNHANAGGFRGTFTESNTMTVLGDALLEMARKTLGPVVTDVLIVDIVRQDG